MKLFHYAGQVVQQSVPCRCHDLMTVYMQYGETSAGRGSLGRQPTMCKGIGLRLTRTCTGTEAVRGATGQATIVLCMEVFWRAKLLAVLYETQLPLSY